MLSIAETPCGHLQAVGTMGEGEHFGEMALIDEGAIRSATITAMTKVECMTLRYVIVSMELVKAVTDTRLAAGTAARILFRSAAQDCAINYHLSATQSSQAPTAAAACVRSSA
eukprot:COSAG01_NODE_20083_length_971_cov_530.774083_1_plen_113_part_00